MHPRLRSLPYLAGVSLLALSASPVLAQQCDQEISQYKQRIAESDLSEEQKTQVHAQLEEARMANQSGNEQACMEAIAGLQNLIPAASAEENVEATAELQVEQPEPQVTVRQKPPKVTVKIGQPTVTVRIPEPEVTVDMPEPEIQVEQQDPEVNVVMAEPQIELAGQQTEQSDAQPQQAMVSVERDEQGPEIQVEQQDPEVKVEQAEPTVNVTRSEQQADPAQTDQQPSRLSIAGLAPDEIIGTDVVNSRDEGIAEISELVKEANGDRIFAILSVGGFLGIGDKEVAIPLDQFDVREDGTFVLSDRTESELESMPAYEPANYQPVDQRT